MDKFDLRSAVNAISDVVQNRPMPIRQFDQIYMKSGDMVSQAVFMAKRFQDKRVVFIGDGDSIALSALHLWKSGVISFAPAHILLLDFDNRIVNAVNRFADKYGFADRIETQLYNVIDPLPSNVVQDRDAFYTNPPWGQSNDGKSVFAFLLRGIEASKSKASGMLIIGDDPELDWTQQVLRDSQRMANEHGFLVCEMVPQQHLYHLDDAPTLKSCACVFRRTIEPKDWPVSSEPMDEAWRQNFYGRNNPMKVKYVRDRSDDTRDVAPVDSYDFEYFV